MFLAQFLLHLMETHSFNKVIASGINVAYMYASDVVCICGRAKSCGCGFRKEGTMDDATRLPKPVEVDITIFSEVTAG